VTAEELIDQATRAGATVVRSGGAAIIVIATATARDPNDLLPLEEAAQIAKCSKRTIRAAGRANQLEIRGKQRSRTVRRADLEAWIAERNAPIVRGADDDAMDRRILRLVRERKSA
jgi:hypothetical protein